MSELSLITFEQSNTPLLHWAIIVKTARENVYHRIHVTGTLQFGYEHELLRRYNLQKEKRPYKLIPLGHLAPAISAQAPDIASGAIPTPSSGTARVDAKSTVPHPENKLEQIAYEIPPPGALPIEQWPPITLSGAEQDAFWGGEIPGVERCDSWIVAYVKALVQAGILTSSAVEIVEKAPRKKVPVIEE